MSIGMLSWCWRMRDITLDHDFLRGPDRSLLRWFCFCIRSQLWMRTLSESESRLQSLGPQRRWMDYVCSWRRKCGDRCFRTGVRVTLREPSTHTWVTISGGNLAVLANRSNVLSNSKRLQGLHNVWKPLMDKERVEHKVLHIQDAVYQELRFVMYYILDRLGIYNVTYDLLNNTKSWSERDKLKLLGQALPAVFTSLPDKIAGMVRLSNSFQRWYRQTG